MPKSIIYNILIYVSILVWIFPVIKQYGTRYFFFFLVLGISDIIVVGIKLLFNSNTIILYIFFNSILFISFFNSGKIKKYVVFVCLVYFVFLIVILTVDDLNIGDFGYSGLLFLLIGIFSFWVSYFFHYLLRYNKINIPLLVLVLYEVISIFKVINWMFYFYEFGFYIYTASAFQILIGLFFSFFSVEDNRLNINVRIKNK